MDENASENLGQKCFQDAQARQRFFARSNFYYIDNISDLLGYRSLLIINLAIASIAILLALVTVYLCFPLTSKVKYLYSASEKRDFDMSYVYQDVDVDNVDLVHDNHLDEVVKIQRLSFEPNITTNIARNLVAEYVIARERYVNNTSLQKQKKFVEANSTSEILNNYTQYLAEMEKTLNVHGTFKKWVKITKIDSIANNQFNVTIEIETLSSKPLNDLDSFDAPTDKFTKVIQVHYDIDTQMFAKAQKQLENKLPPMDLYFKVTHYNTVDKSNHL